MSVDSSFKAAQRGVILVEAMIGMVLAGLIATATVYAVARAGRAQNSANLRSAAVDQIRARLMQEGVALCGVSRTVTVAGKSLSVNYSCTPYSGVAVTFPGVTTPVSVTLAATSTQKIQASVTDDVLGGTLTVSSAQ